MDPLLDLDDLLGYLQNTIQEVTAQRSFLHVIRKAQEEQTKTLANVVDYLAQLKPLIQDLNKERVSTLRMNRQIVASLKLINETLLNLRFSEWSNDDVTD